ncbi:MAG TPA: SDR family NAD(P)-dependent oxidoreductase [Acetobacteraceae bacterium]|nr:SDR family NAD(P)-dependent oxidoreductase [Acetobacteraceae bacterium]
MELPRTPSLRLDGRRALVTGAGRGIGLACAAALAQAGAHVVLAARTTSEVEELAEAIRRDGGSADPVTLDITDLKAAVRFVAESPPFDILVNNAGTNRPATFLEVTVADFDHVVDLNLRAAFFITQAVVRRMVESGKQGSVINISSDMGLVGGPNRTVYCASKHGMEGFTKAMAIDLGPHGIRVNTICPTFIDTPLARRFLANDEVRSWVLSRIKLGRIGKVEDLMGAVVFLASDASALMTGSAMLVDGGWAAD